MTRKPENPKTSYHHPNLLDLQKRSTTDQKETTWCKKEKVMWRREGESCRQSEGVAMAGGDWRRETPPESPPEGSSIPLRHLDQHHHQDQHLSITIYCKISSFPL
jgi:hypothetical protein